MQQYFSQDILNRLSVGGKILDKTTRNGLFFLTLLLFIIALGRPVIDQKEHSLQQNLIPIVIALDVSKSMRATDIYPNRIEMAKKKLKNIIKLSKNSTIGIILFAKDSFVLSPVTEDFISLGYIVKNIDTNLDFTNGSNIYATLEATSYMLEDFQVKNLIILSDGGNNDSYTKELEFAKQNHITIYSIGIATKKGSPIPQKNGYLTDKNGNIVTVKLNPSIKKLSLNSGGGYIDFTIDNSDIKAIIQRINNQSKKEKLETQKIKTYTELFYYPLGLALVVLLIALSSFPTINNTKKINTASGLVLVLILSILSTTTKADFFEFKNIEKAKQFYNQKKYQDASDEYRKISVSAQSLYNLANSLYKDKKYKEAIDTYSKVITTDQELESKKLHNIGNSYVKSNNLEKAKEFYEKSLKIKYDKQTKENLDIVTQELNKKRKKRKNNKHKQNKKQNRDDKKNSKNQEKKEKQNRKDKGNPKDKQNKNQKKQKNQKNQDNQNENRQQQQNKNNSKGEGSAKQRKKELISDMEEKKWIDMLHKEKTPILLRKVKTTKKVKIDETQPW